MVWHHSPSFIATIRALGSLQNTENEANLMLPLHQNLKGFQLQGGLPLTPLTRSSAGGSAPTLPYRLALAICVHPELFDLATPLCRTN